MGAPAAPEPEPVGVVEAEEDRRSTVRCREAPRTAAVPRRRSTVALNSSATEDAFCQPRRPRVSSRRLETNARRASCDVHGRGRLRPRATRTAAVRTSVGRAGGDRERAPRAAPARSASRRGADRPTRRADRCSRLGGFGHEQSDADGQQRATRRPSTCAEASRRGAGPARGRAARAGARAAPRCAGTPPPRAAAASAAAVPPVRPGAPRSKVSWFIWASSCSICCRSRSRPLLAGIAFELADPPVVKLLLGLLLLGEQAREERSGAFLELVPQRFPMPFDGRGDVGPAVFEPAAPRFESRVLEGNRIARPLRRSGRRRNW